MYCKDEETTPFEEDLPDMDMGEMGEELSKESQNPQSQSEHQQPQPDTGS